VSSAVMIAVDPHKASNTAAVLDSVTKMLIESARFANTADGYVQLAGFAARWQQRRWAVEGSRMSMPGRITGSPRAGASRPARRRQPSLISSLIHPRPAPFTAGRRESVRAGHGRWRLPVNAGQHCWKACWGQPLRSSNLLSSATLTCGDAISDTAGRTSSRSLSLISLSQSRGPEAAARGLGAGSTLRVSPGHGIGERS
jgi:hypothetical protein